MTPEPEYCPIRRHWCYCPNRCDDFDDEKETKDIRPLIQVHPERINGHQEAVQSRQKGD